MASPARSSALHGVVNDLREMFGSRLEAVVAYGWRPHGPVPSLVLLDAITLDDLSACAARVQRWHRQGAETPLLLTHGDFSRSLDAFPVEYGEILANHEVLHGADPFAGLSIASDDLRRACEVQVKSHLLHLRENYLESGGRPSEVEQIVRESAPGFEALLRYLARLDGLPSETRRDLTNFAVQRIALGHDIVDDLLALDEPDGVRSIDALRLFPGYLATMERLAEFVDRWRA